MPSGFACQWHSISAPIFQRRLTHWNYFYDLKDPPLMKMKIRRALVENHSLVFVPEFRSDVHFSTNESWQSLFKGVEEDEHAHERGAGAPLTERKSLPPWGDVSVDQHLNSIPPNHKQYSKFEDLSNMDEVKVHFLETIDEELLSNRVLVLSRTNKIRSAMELFRSMELLGLFPNIKACNSLMSSLLRNRHFDDCLKLFNIMRKRKVTTAHTYSMMLKAVKIAQGCDAALKLFKELESDAKEEFDAVVYNTIISIMGEQNDWVEIEFIWMKMTANGCVGTQVTYYLLISCFVRSGQAELALDAYQEMVQMGLVPGSDTMQAIISVCTKEGKWKVALGVFQEMLKRGLKPNLVVCNALVNSLGKASKIKQAFEVFNIMKSLGELPDAYTCNALLNALYNAGSHDDVLHLFDIIKRKHTSLLNVHLYNKALLSCSKLGSWDTALQLLWQMEASKMSVSTESYNLVIQACEVAGEPEVSIQVYEHMVHQKCIPDTFTHMCLLRSCIWGSLWDYVEDILNVAPNASLYNAAIHGMCLFGKINLAKKLYKEMHEKGLQPDSKTRALIHLKRWGRRKTF